MRRVNATAHTPEVDPSSIGNLAIELGYITEVELRAAVQVQQQRLPLGRILVEMGKLTEEQLEDLLFEQRVRRGEIQDKAVIVQHRRAKMRRTMTQLKAEFKEVGSETKRLADALFGPTQTMKFRAK